MTVAGLRPRPITVPGGPTRRATATALAVVLAAGLLSAGGPTAPARADDTAAGVTAAAVAAAPSVLVDQRAQQLAPGLTLTSFQRLQPGGWVTGHVMDADLTTASLSLDVVDGGEVSASNATVETFAREAGAVAAVNGDYFDINASEAPVGTNISPTTGVRTAAATARESFTLTAGRAAVQQLMSSATLTTGDLTVRLRSVNSPGVPADTSALFTGAWGEHPIGALLPADETVRVITITDGTVTAVSDARAALDAPTAIPDGASLVVARGTAAAELADLTVGDPADLTVEASADVDLAVGGSQRLVTDGRPTTEDQVTAARTAIGVSRDGSAIKVITIDGRGADAHGMTIQELAAFMVDLGVWNAVNLDGGGSTTLVARPAGTDDLRLVNRPSDGSQRVDSNALVFRSTAVADGDTAPAGVSLRPTGQPAAGLSAPDRLTLLPGLTRTLVGTALDPDLAATPADAPQLTGDDGAVTVGSPDRQGAYDAVTVTGVHPGTTTVTYRAGDQEASTTMTVHGPMQRLVASSPVLALEEPDATGTLTLEAVDGDGFGVPVETPDVTVRASRGIVVTPVRAALDGRPGDVDRFVVAATAGTRSGTIDLIVAGHRTRVAVTVGTVDEPVADFAEVDDWEVGTARATGTISPATGPEGGPALALDFDFTTSTGTRGMYAVAAEPIPLPGRPQSLSLWINGTGKGEWPRLEVTRGDGTVTNLDGDLITFTGWQQVRFPVPPGTAYPLTLRAVRLLETRAAVSYTDRVEIAELTAQVPPPVDVPAATPVTDPVIITQGTVDDRPMRIALMSDSQFVARDPDSDLVAAARRTLREIVAADPDLLIIAGDFVDEAAPADIALAKRILDEEVGTRLPYVYVPGNHEIMGGSIENFRAVFGETSTTRTIAGTMIITLDSSTGTLHPGGSTEQVQLLEAELARAAADPTITGVIVVDHHPVDDPLPGQASQLTDRVEADALNRTLSQFSQASGKHVAQLNGHVGVFHGSARDGISRMINGNSGKSPSGTPAAGGFTGWSMVGVDPQATPRTDWLAVETRARVDEVIIDAPATLTRGGRGTATATLTQDGTRQVPVGWPLSATWGGDGVGLLGGRPNPRTVVLVDPTTGDLRAMRPGVATLTVTVNGVTASRTITVR